MDTAASSLPPLSFEPSWQRAYLSLTAYYAHQNTPLSEAIAYVLEAPGKQLRAHLCLLAAQMLGEPPVALRAALALEMVHAYSLIHDDLPAMDHAATRRGRPTLHVKYSEAMAILAGDALLSDAFAVLAGDTFTPPAASRTEAEQSLGDLATPSHKARLAQTLLLSKAIGGRGMVLGQTYDTLPAASAPDAFVTLPPFLLADALPFTQAQEWVPALKTGSLFAASLGLGALATLLPAHGVVDGEGSDAVVQKLLRLGYLMGVAYQLADDLQDHLHQRGKPPHRDRDLGRRNMVLCLGASRTKSYYLQLRKRSLELLLTFQEPSDILRQWLEHVFFIPMR